MAAPAFVGASVGNYDGNNAGAPLLQPAETSVGDLLLCILFDGYHPPPPGFIPVGSSTTLCAKIATVAGVGPSVSQPAGAMRGMSAWSGLGSNIHEVDVSHWFTDVQEGSPASNTPWPSLSDPSSFLILAWTASLFVPYVGPLSEINDPSTPSGTTRRSALNLSTTNNRSSPVGPGARFLWYSKDTPPSNPTGTFPNNATTTVDPSGTGGRLYTISAAPLGGGVSMLVG